MSHGDRTGPMGKGSRTGRAMGYCSGSDSPGYMTRIPADTARNAGRGEGRRIGQGAGCGASRGFWCRKISGFGRGEESAARSEYPGYYYPAPAETSMESNVKLFENMVRSLKQELETFIESLKTQQTLEIDEKK